jgi:hypothetical protein
MARLPLALATAALAVTFGTNLAVAQSSPAYNTPTALSPTGQPVQPPMTPEMGSPGARPMPPRGARPMPPAAPMGSSSMSGGMSSGAMSGGMAPGGAASTTMTPQGPMVQTPAQPFSGLSLPNQPSVGDGAYGGGGVVLEYLPDGTRRVVQQ